jgi:hypothetical protein
MKDFPFSEKEYHVIVLSSPIRIPFNMFKHLWIVLIRKNQVTRWEVMPDGNIKRKHGFLYKNFHKDPRRGAQKFFFNTIDYWGSEIIFEISGGQNSQAMQVLNDIEELNNSYPHKTTYFPFPGPNSNTYVGWLLDHFPELNITLPWNAFGKNYK